MSTTRMDAREWPLPDLATRAEAQVRLSSSIRRKKSLGLFSLARGLEASAGHRHWQELWTKYWSDERAISQVDGTWLTDPVLLARYVADTGRAPVLSVLGHQYEVTMGYALRPEIQVEVNRIRGLVRAMPPQIFEQAEHLAGRQPVLFGEPKLIS